MPGYSVLNTAVSVFMHAHTLFNGGNLYAFTAEALLDYNRTAF